MKNVSLVDGVFLLIVLFLVGTNYQPFGSLIGTGFAGVQHTIQILQGRSPTA
jgi:hypothetical protein